MTASGSHSRSFENPVIVVMKSAAKNPNDA